MQKLSMKQKFLGLLAIMWLGLLILGYATFYANPSYELASLFVFGLILTGIIWMVIRSVTQSVGGEPMYAVDIATRIADGDLDLQVAVDANDSTSLLYAMKSMQQRLVTTVQEIRDGSDSITLGTREIAAGNTDLSARTEQQAASLEQTAASMEQLTATVRQNADNARQAGQLAQTASDIAAKGGEVVGKVVETMHGISESSRRIADIISVIDGIAFQTNILALNAAVEAARAGEQGRGFAVVAGEVRTLAQRSAQAAKEIKELIDVSAVRVESGSELVSRAGSTMDEVVQAVRRVTDIMGEIASASEEQSSGIAQVNQAVIQMDQVTQQNASLVEEAAAAAGSLEQQAQRLHDTVSVFRLQQNGQYEGQATARRAQALHVVAPAKPAQRAAIRPASTYSTGASPSKRLTAVAMKSAVKAGNKPNLKPRPKPDLKPVPSLASTKVAASDNDWETF